MSSSDNFQEAIKDAAAAALRVAELTAKMEQLSQKEDGFDFQEWKALEERLYLMGFVPLVVGMSQARLLLEGSLNDRGGGMRVDLRELEW